MCSRQSIGWHGLWRACCPSCHIFGAVRFETKRRFLDSARERRCSCAVDFWNIVVKPRRRKTTRTYSRFWKSRWNNELEHLWVMQANDELEGSRWHRTSSAVLCILCHTLYSVTETLSPSCQTTLTSRNDKKRLSDVSVLSVPQSWPRWAHSVSHTPVTVERSIKFEIDRKRDAAAKCWRLAPVTHAGHAASSPEIFWPFSAVCLTVFLFEFRPRTFTIGFYGKKSYQSLWIWSALFLECLRRDGGSAWLKMWRTLIPLPNFIVLTKWGGCPPPLRQFPIEATSVIFGRSFFRGAWRDRDTNDIFAHCSLIFYFLDFKFSNFVCPSELHPLIWLFLKIPSGKWKYPENNQKRLSLSIFIVFSTVLKLCTPLLHTQAQDTLLQNF